MNREILLDMDGVIVDLRPPIADLSSDDLSAFYRGELKVTTDIWAGIDADWWANLHWTIDGKEILKLCEKWVGKENVVLCSYACNALSAAGKICWIAHEMPDYAFQYILTPQKYRCASPRSLLIDDTDKNVAAFRKAGGAALLCPRRWNAYRNIADQGLQFIDMMLEEMTS